MENSSGDDRQNRRLNRFWLAAILLLSLTALLLAASLFFSRAPLATVAQAQESGTQAFSMPVETLEVRIETAQQQLAAVGSLQSKESVQLSPEIAGRVVSIGFTEGQSGSKGQLLVQLDDTVLKAQLDQAQANLELHEADYRRAEALLKDRAISQQERDTAFAQWSLDKASVRLARAQRQKTRIVAPFDGTLGLRQVSPGDYVQPGTVLVNLEATDTLKVEFRIPEKYAAQVKLGQPLTLQSGAYPGRDFIGELYAINPHIELNSRSLVIRGRLDNRDGLLLPGQFVQVQLTVASRSEAVFIPEQALLPQAQASLVFKVVDGKAQMVPVETGQRRKGWIEITGGLAAGDVVVTGGHQKIGPGSPVRPLPADPKLFAKL